MYDKFLEYKENFFCSGPMKRNKLSDSQLVFKLGEERVQNNLNMFTIIKTIQKMKASISVLLKDDDLKLRDIRKVYVEN